MLSRARSATCRSPLLPYLAMNKPVVYCYDKCGTCRKALTWLGAHGIHAVTRPIRESPPDARTLRFALTVLGVGGRQKLLNTSGTDYRELGGRQALDLLGDEELVSLLCARGNLIKRPFVVLDETVLVGFDPEKWTDAFL
jgi:arsenate reductase